MANPRRSTSSILIPNYQNPDSVTNNNNPPFQIQPQSIFQTTAAKISSSLKLFLKKPHAFPCLLFVFLLLTWVSLRFQHSAHFSSPPHFMTTNQWSRERDGGGDGGGGDSKVNLVRFPAGYPSPVAKDRRGWSVDPIALALRSGISGGAVNCASVHLGEIRPGGVRGNHRHYTCNETFYIWGAKTLFRLENKTVDRGYAEVTIGADEVAVAASPHGTAHALVNVDTARSTFFMGCQDSIINYSNSTTDFNVWKDL